MTKLKGSFCDSTKLGEHILQVAWISSDYFESLLLPQTRSNRMNFRLILQAYLIVMSERERYYKRPWMFITYSYRFLISRRLSSFLTTYWPFTSSVSIYAIHFLRSLRCWVAIIFATWLLVTHAVFVHDVVVPSSPRVYHLSLSMSRNAWHSLDLQQPQTKQMEVKKDKKSKGRRTQVKKIASILNGRLQPNPINDRFWVRP